jgi:hypothetical protein
MADCTYGFFASRYGQYVKNGDTMAFNGQNGGLESQTFCHMQSIKLHTLEVMLKIYDLNSPLQAKVLVP